MKEKLFIYGTLKNKKVQKEIIKREIKGSKATVKGKIIKIGKYKALKKGNKTITGKIIKVTKTEIKQITKYEGKQYKLKKIETNKGKAYAYMKA